MLTCDLNHILHYHAFHRYLLLKVIISIGSFTLLYSFSHSLVHSCTIEVVFTVTRPTILLANYCRDHAYCNIELACVFTSASYETFYSFSSFCILFNSSIRYAFKLMYDEAVLGPIDDFEEMAECLFDYENNWHMGNDDEDTWVKAVLGEIPNLASVGYNKEDVSIRIFTLKPLGINNT